MTKRSREASFANSINDENWWIKVSIETVHKDQIIIKDKEVHRKYKGRCIWTQAPV